MAAADTAVAVLDLVLAVVTAPDLALLRNLYLRLFARGVSAGLARVVVLDVVLDVSTEADLSRNPYLCFFTEDFSAGLESERSNSPGLTSVVVLDVVLDVSTEADLLRNPYLCFFTEDFSAGLESERSSCFESTKESKESRNEVEPPGDDILLGEAFRLRLDT
jgi:hypothetical protein